MPSCAQLELADRERSHGITLLHWTQEVDGIPLLEGSLRAAVTDDGRIVNIAGGAHPDLPRPGNPRLDDAAAIAAAAAATGAGDTRRGEGDPRDDGGHRRGRGSPGACCGPRAAPTTTS